VVRFEVTLEDITARVNAVQPTWLARAEDRTKAFVAAGKFAEASSIWSEIKTVFIELQHQKCAYCERSLPGEAFGSAEYDLEHYRPKGRVQAWPAQTDGLNYAFKTGTKNANGYYWLAYTLGNYAVACKSCNSGLKLDRFPIAGVRGKTVTDIAALNEAEKPFLLFPIGGTDDNPRDLIGFLGAVPFTKAKMGRKQRRAQVTIDFFRLGDPKREELFRDRFELIRSVWGQIKIANDPNGTPEEREDAKATLEVLRSSRSAHSSCANAFVQLFEQDPRKAYAVAREAAKYLAAPRDERISWL
jgi:hypothetical protein